MRTTQLGYRKKVYFLRKCICNLLLLSYHIYSDQAEHFMFDLLYIHVWEGCFYSALNNCWSVYLTIWPNLPSSSSALPRLSSHSSVLSSPVSSSSLPCHPVRHIQIILNTIQTLYQSTQSQTNSFSMTGEYFNFYFNYSFSLISLSLATDHGNSLDLP